MFVVYWLENAGEGQTATPRCAGFAPEDMTGALTFMESLRRDLSNSFVTFASENPNSVGKPGVDVVGPDYDWKKRRM